VDTRARAPQALTRTRASTRRARSSYAFE
jgi:hypothetical protein